MCVELYTLSFFPICIIPLHYPHYLFPHVAPTRHEDLTVSRPAEYDAGSGRLPEQEQRLVCVHAAVCVFGGGMDLSGPQTSNLENSRTPSCQLLV